MLKNTRSNDKYVSILSDGLLHLGATEETEGAIKREYETSDGTKVSKWELVYTELSGMITKVAFQDGDYGKSLRLTVTDDKDESVVLSVNTQNNFGEDLMKKLPNVDLTKGVKFAPYSFEDDKGKKRKGVTVYQDDKKIENFYYDREKKENTNGYPVPSLKKGKKWSKEEWKLYFLQARVFLIEDITKRFNIDVPSEDKEFDDLVANASLD